jgi:hypothetical protein
MEFKKIQAEPDEGDWDLMLRNEKHNNQVPDP